MYNLLANIDKDTLRFFVAAPDEEPFYPKLKQLTGVTVFPLNLRELKWTNLSSLIRIVKENDINIVHSHGKGAGIWSRLLKLRFPRLIVVHHFHGIHYKQYPRWAHNLYFIFEKLASLLTDKIIHVSNSERQEASNRIHIAASRQQVINNGVELLTRQRRFDKQELRRELNLPVNTFLIICVARYSFAKNLKHSIRIIGRLRERNIPAHYVIVGGEDDIPETTITQYLKTENLENHVTLAGSQLVVPPWLEASDVFLSTSRWEGLPTAVMEAMTEQLPVVASDVTGNRSLVNESNGFLIAENDTDAFCDALQLLYGSPEKRTELGESGHNMVKQGYSIEKMVQSHEALYNSFQPVVSKRAVYPDSRPSDSSILLDARMIKGSGISTYIVNLLDYFQKAGQPPRIELLLPPRNTLNNNKDLLDKYAIHQFNQEVYSIGEQVFLPKAMKYSKLLHVPHYNAPLIYNGTLIVTIHDICHHTMSHFFPGLAKRLYSNLFLKQVLKKADQIITVSEFSKQEILKYFDVPENKIEVVYNGIDSHFYRRSQDEINEVRKKYQLPEKYLLYVGNIRPHKNIAGLVNAYAHAWREDKSIPPLVLCGIWQQGYDVFRELNTFSRREKKLIKQQVFSPGYMNYRDLPAFYSGAEAFLYLSFYEGFGIPPLEAMACGIPVVASSTSAIPEICGDSALLVPPDEPEVVADAILKVLDDREERFRLNQHAKERLKNFSWDFSGEQHLKIYERWL